ncbi:MAG: hypothetical protein L0Y36_08005 [Planctomycetales bacterium]|nr:hypothetical protein [Planctomycetales bacterium]
MQDISSEQELKQLLEEGKITEEEYRQLLEAIHQKDKPQPPIEQPPQTKPRTGYGKAALILFILSVMLPIFAVLLSFVFFATKMKMLLAAPLLLIGLLCALLAFIFGIIGFKSPAGKIAAIGVPCLALMAVVGIIALVPLAYVSTREEVPQAEIRHFISHKAYPLDSLEGVLSQSNVEIDPTLSFDGKGSLKAQSDTLQRTVIRLFETGPIEVEDRILIYEAKIKTDLSMGKAYLEMWCDIPGKGEFFSRGLDRPVTGTTEWTTVQTPFRLESGQMPANVKLNLVIEGTGTVWIDDIKLSSSPLN